jgi:O-antigen/teichoic acid export membrane protein
MIGDGMGRFNIFLVRLVLSLALGFLIVRGFFHGASILYVIALAAVMFFLAYLFEHTKKKDRGGIHGSQ